MDGFFYQKYGEIAQKSCDLLSGDAIDAIGGYVLSCQCPGGGFAMNPDGGGDADLYFTYFALQTIACLKSAADAELFPYAEVFEKAEVYLDSFEDGEKLDLVHLTSLMQSHILLRSLKGGSNQIKADYSGCIENLRQFFSDAGFVMSKGETESLVYADFLAMSALDKFVCCENGIHLDDAEKARNLLSYQQKAVNGRTGIPAERAVSVLAADIAVRARFGGLDSDFVSGVRQFLLQSYDSGTGGFRLCTEAPAAGLLSTATGIYALTLLGEDTGRFGGSLAGFVDQCRCNDGGFSSAPEDDTSTVEYTFYALLALGCLAAGFSE